ncbi:N-acetyltransferase [Cereibacter sphaeroides]|uniref:GNAT family N-acetyltransferase n=1 Tax=Cereibacter sphaeroides TaxID=1063 RepID=UPI00313CFEE0
MLIRNEVADDIPAVRAVVTEAMTKLAQSTGTEAQIIDRLRDDKALALSLVAEDGGRVVGYLAASQARIGAHDGWGLIGPLAVLPSRHRQGIGSTLMAAAILRLRATFQGAVLVGDPGYYGRFGFRACPGLGVGAVPSDFVLALPFDAAEPRGEVIHHPAFGLKQQA